MSEFTIRFLGTSASVPTPQRGLPATLIQHEGKRFLVDCGEGTQRQMMMHGGLKAPDAIFITHYHPDHTLGLPGLLATLNMMEHDQPVDVYGPEGIEGLRMLCINAGHRPSFVRFHQTHDHNTLVRVDGMDVTAFRTDHGRTRSQGYVFDEYDRPGRFDVEKAKALGVQPGPDYAKLQRGEDVLVDTRGKQWRDVHPHEVMGPERRGRKVVITGDTRPCSNTWLAAQGADLLIHEATFTQANVERAKQVGHSTVAQARVVAKRANVKELVLTHFSPRESFKDLQAEAQGDRLARDGDIISLPVK